MNQGENAKPKKTAALDNDFHPMILRGDESFCVYLPEWNVSGEGASLEEAFKQYELNKKAVALRAAKYGLATIAPEPYPTFKRVVIFQNLGMFFLKVATSAFAVILVVILLLPHIGAAFRHQVRALVPAEFREYKYWAIQLPTQMNARMDRLKPEEEKQMNDEWNRLLGRTAPILSPLACQPQDKAKSSRK